VVNEHRIRFEGAAAAALTVATAIADADGVDLISSEPPTPLADGKVRLDLSVQASAESIAAALDGIGPTLPADGSIELDPS
jgi:hypothetical protein